MICPKCASEVPDDEMFCKNCGASLKKSRRSEFVINIPDDKISLSNTDEISADLLNENATDDESFNEAVSEEIQQNETWESDDVEQTTDELTAMQNESEDRVQQIETGVETDVDTEPVQDHQLQERVQEKNSELSHPNQNRRRKADPHKKTYLAIKLIALFCAFTVVLLTVLSAVTDIFEYNPNKTVVLSGLSSEQKSSFEQYAVKLSSLFESGYNSKTTVLDDVLELMKPDSSDGLYAGFFEKKQVITEGSDPAGRFATGENSFGYCKVSDKDIETIAEGLNLDAFHDANDVGFYYYGGAYYFAETDSDEKAEAVAVKVDDAKQTQSGNYYITCSLYPEGEVPENKKDSEEAAIGKEYFLVSFETTDEENNWKIIEISDEPILEKQASDDNEKDGESTQTPVTSLDFEMKCETITIKTTSGDVYAEYVVEYPYFESNGITQSAINNIYSELVDSYKAQVEDADEMYITYVEKGYDKQALPLYTHIVASIAYNDNGYLSLVERKTEYNPETVSEEEETTTSRYSYNVPTTPEQSDEEKVSLPKTTYEGYTYVIESGDFVKKDDVLGKDYQKTQKMLYEQYYTAKHKNVSDEQSEEETTTSQNPWSSVPSNSDDTIPNDIQGIGEAIYSSAWLLAEEGVLFCYQNEDGALDKVILPYDKIENMSIKLN